MKVLRLGLSVLAVLGLGAGYAGSQVYAVQGRAPEWARLVDTPAIAWAALALLVASLALWLVPEREDRQ